MDNSSSSSVFQRVHQDRLRQFFSKEGDFRMPELHCSRDWTAGVDPRSSSTHYFSIIKEANGHHSKGQDQRLEKE